MKQLLLLFTLCLSTTLFSQDYIKLAETNFETAEECKEAEPKVLECANYLLNTSAKANELNRLSAFQYIFKWMEGTADYTFSIDADVVDLTKGDTNYMSVYFAAMVQTVLQNQGDKLSDEAMHQAAVDKLVSYCEDSANGLKPNRAIKKIIKKRKKS
ncbi:hypothetical protein [Winogradskyella sp.]|uniref:hypothetical protein n=2 Tax=Winogradskyella sp. TaxID=1883156 RepID=UPI003513C6F0